MFLKFWLIIHFNNCGRNEDTISTNKPTTNTKMVLEEHPFHSFRIIPHTFEKVTFSDMRMHHEKVSNTGDDARKPLPKLNPKNWLYHRIPASAQNSRLLAYKVLLP